MRNRKKIAFVALGCAKNLVDSEKMLGQLAEHGGVITAEQAEAEVIVINTCGFLQAARTEAHEEIARAVEFKTTGQCRRVVVAGCLVQRDGQGLLEAVPGIDALVGVHRRDDLVRAVFDVPADRARSSANKAQSPDLYLGDYHPNIVLDTARLRLTPQHYAYLRITEGCSQECTFCTIPAIRGPLRSKPPETILEEARELISDGVAELNLIGQDTTSYGRDLRYQPGLSGLLRELNRLDGLKWIRLLYAYPTGLTDEMIDTIADCDKVVNYLDIPLQHINDRILKAMHRRITRDQTERLLQKLRERIPGVALRSTLIAGFPGETETEFEELLAFVRQAKFAALGVFPYSHEADTPAGRMKGVLPEQTRSARADAIMELQQQIAFDQAAQQVGKSFEVLIDQQADDDQFIARHLGQAPEVDSVTYVLSDQLHPGEFVHVLCEGSKEYDLIARPTEGILP